MEFFRPIPIDVIQINQKSVVDLFIKHDYRLMPFLDKVKAATFYISSIHALKNAFDNPNPGQIEKIKVTLKYQMANVLEDDRGNKL